MKNINKTTKKSIAIIIVLVGIIAVCMYGYLYLKPGSDIQTFSGKITGVEECSEYIGIGGDSCTWIVSGNKVLYTWGSSLESMNNRPTVTGLHPDGGEGDVGKTVEVHATKIGNKSYELKDSSDYIIVK